MKFKIINILLIMVILNGVISALSKCMGISLPVSPISIIIMTSIPFVIYLFIFAIQKKYVNNFINILFFSIFLIMTFKLLYFALDLNMASIIFTYIYYVFPLFYFYLATSLNKKQIEKLIKTIFIIGTIILIISYLQLLFHDSLSSCITDLPSLSSVGKEKYMREYLDQIFYRPNGLISNPITLGYFLLILLSITIYYFNLYNEKKYILLTLLISFMIISLLSRTNIMNMFLLFMFFIYYRFGLFKAILVSLIIIIILFISLPILYDQIPIITFIIDRFTGSDTYATASTQIHFNEFASAIDYIKKYFLFGIPEGVYVGSEQIITDGTWLSLVLHFGILGFIPYFLIWAYLIYFSFILSKDGDYKGLFFPIFFITVIENIFNSATLDKGINILIWILFGLSYRLNQINIIRKKHD